MGNFAEQIISNYSFLGRHCEIAVIFRDPLSTAPVSVENQKIKISKKINNDGENGEFQEVIVEKLVDFTPSPIKEGEYKYAFLSDKLVSGEYLVEALGYYPNASVESNKIEVKQKFQIYEVSSKQSWIIMLRTQLHDHLPELYILDDPTKYRWSDGDLFMALERSVQFWNETPPQNPSISNYNIDNFPYWDIMLWGAEFYALNQKGLLEILNTINFSDEGIINIDRWPKYQAKINIILEQWVKRVKEMKYDLTIRRSQILGIKSSKMPLRAIRALSFIPNLSFMSTGGYY